MFINLVKDNEFNNDKDMLSGYEATAIRWLA